MPYAPYIPYTVDIATTPPPGWDAMIAAGQTDSLPLYHTTLWANRFRDLTRCRPYYLRVLDDGSPLLALLLLRFPLVRPYELQSFRDYLVLAKKICLGPRKTCGWHGQPVAMGAPSPDAYLALARALSDHARGHGWRLAFGQWPVAAADALPDGWRRAPWGTIKVALSGDAETAMASFKPAARKAIRKATADGITVRRVDSLDGLREYFRFALESAKRYGKTNLYWKDYELCWRHFRKEPGIFETFAAERDGRILSGLSVYGFAGHIMELGSFQSEYAFQEKLYGADLIKWECIRLGQASGWKSFDLAGVNPAPATDKEANIRRFKEKWGGRYLEFLTLEGAR